MTRSLRLSFLPPPIHAPLRLQISHPGLPMICARRVFRCFKTLERWGNKITGAAGPYFVGLAIILISMGVTSFCELRLTSMVLTTVSNYNMHYTVDVIAPGLSYPLISVPTCLLIAFNLLGHYYHAVTVPPGFIDEPPREPGTGLMWAKKKGDGKGKGKQRVLTRGTGVRWSTRGVKITPALYTKCWKCNKPRPEVGSVPLFYSWGFGY